MTAAVLMFQGLYYFLRGLWPIAHLHSFVLVTGETKELWIVKTFGIVLAAIGLTLLAAVGRKKIKLKIFALAFFSAAACCAIDLFYSFFGEFPAVYMADGVIELLIAGFLLVTFPRERDMIG